MVKLSPVIQRAVCQLPLDHVIGHGKRDARLALALRILGVGCAHLVGDDLLHRRLDIEIEEAVPEAHLEGTVRIQRQQMRFTRIMPVQIFDDDAGFRNGAVTRLIPQDRHLADRPVAEQLGPRTLIREIDQPVLERRAVLIKRDQNLVAEGSERMSVEHERHGHGLSAVGNFAERLSIRVWRLWQGIVC
ncbi:hypothetical protein ABIE40_002109 [Rhizobium sp. OAE497]